MNHDDYTNTLAQYLDPQVRERVLGEDAPAQDLPNVPLGNFFGDDFFTLLYRSNESNSPSLDRIRQKLLLVSGSEQPRHIRAAAAMALGRFVQSRCSDDKYVSGSSRPEQWFHLSRQLNSVIGALALANTLLAQRDLRVEFDLQVDPLPRLVETKERVGRLASGVNQEAAQAWYLGARVALRHVQRRFSGWDSESFGCALACVVNYLTLMPSRRLSEHVCPVRQRRQALVWIKPLWNRLIDVASQHALDADTHRAALIEQQLAVLLCLDDLEQNGAPVSARSEPTLTSARAAKTTGPNQIVVVPGVIPMSSDRAETDYLKQFEVLRRPMAFKALPSLNTLYELRATLSAEFPWAQEAISLVMSDLFARRRHGVVRLGMAPVLLVGPPGTGKTRFVQRLSELLDTPNTVINLAGMTDVKLLKGVTRGWASNRASRVVEFILQTKVPNPIFILDEIDKAQAASGNGGDPQDALLDLLEPGNAKRYQDIYLMTECDLSHCSYIATSNSLEALSEPLLSRLRPVLFPAPGPEYSDVILRGVLRDMERAWNLPQGALAVTPRQVALMRGLSPREMRRALLELLGGDTDQAVYTQH